MLEGGHEDGAVARTREGTTQEPRQPPFPTLARPEGRQAAQLHIERHEAAQIGSQ